MYYNSATKLSYDPHVVKLLRTEGPVYQKKSALIQKISAWMNKICILDDRPLILKVPKSCQNMFYILNELDKPNDRPPATA